MPRGSLLNSSSERYCRRGCTTLALFPGSSFGSAGPFSTLSKRTALARAKPFQCAHEKSLSARRRGNTANFQRTCLGPTCCARRRYGGRDQGRHPIGHRHRDAQVQDFFLQPRRNLECRSGRERLEGTRRIWPTATQCRDFILGHAWQQARGRLLLQTFGRKN